LIRQSGAFSFPKTNIKMNAQTLSKLAFEITRNAGPCLTTEKEFLAACNKVMESMGLEPKEIILLKDYLYFGGCFEAYNKNRFNENKS